MPLADARLRLRFRPAAWQYRAAPGFASRCGALARSTRIAAVRPRYAGSAATAAAGRRAGRQRYPRHSGAAHRAARRCGNRGDAAQARSSPTAGGASCATPGASKRGRQGRFRCRPELASCSKKPMTARCCGSSKPPTCASAMTAAGRHAAAAVHRLEARGRRGRCGRLSDAPCGEGRCRRRADGRAALHPGALDRARRRRRSAARP